jgi:hypothetical protein
MRNDAAWSIGLGASDLGIPSSLIDHSQMKVQLRA